MSQDTPNICLKKKKNTDPLSYDTHRPFGAISKELAGKYSHYRRNR